MNPIPPIKIFMQTLVSLAQLRKEIDEIDANLLQLLNQRAKCVIQIGQLKQAENTVIVHLDREQQLLQRLCKLNQGPLSNEMLQQLFQSMIDSMKELQTVSN